MVNGSASRAEIPYVKGRFRRILAPPGYEKCREAGPEALWYVNDHCFFVTDAGVIHWFGISNPYPADDDYYGPGSHRHAGHASAEHPYGPWREHPDALCLPETSESNIGACFVAQDGDQYLMVYGYNTGLSVACSPNLLEWTPVERRDRILLGRGTRDPCIVQLGPDRYVLYVAAGHGDCGAVCCASSTNLLDWTQEVPALVSDVPGDWGPLESPFVFERRGLYYLSVNYSHHQYEETLVFASRDPLRFEWEEPLCTIFGHACEVFDWRGTTYISHCGIEDRHWEQDSGLYLAELGWAQP